MMIMGVFRIQVYDFKHRRYQRLRTTKIRFKMGITDKSGLFKNKVGDEVFNLIDGIHAGLD